MKPDIFLQTISDIINITYKVSFSGANATLKHSSGDEIKLNKQGKFLCLSFDNVKNHFPFFNMKEENLCKISDYYIFYPKQDQFFVFIIELKTTNPTGAMKQVRAGYEFCKYICQTAKRLHNYPQNIDIQYRGLVLSKKTYSGGSKPDNFYQTDPLATELQHQHLPEKQSINLEILAY